MVVFPLSGSINQNRCLRYSFMRKPRELQAGAMYHVSARANRKEMIMEKHEIKDLFLSVIKEAKRKYEFRIENFCILGNHFHIMIRPGDGECLSSIMQWILGVFAMRFNRALKLSGHVWGERFFSRIIANVRQYYENYIYIDENPRRAGLVVIAQDWLYGRFNLREIGCEGLIDIGPPAFGRT
jgi:putative transposase